MTELKLTRTSADRRLYGDRESNVRILPGAANRVQVRCTGSGSVRRREHGRGRQATPA